MRFHTQTAGSTLTAQQPLNNIVRTTVQALAATLGGTQSLHTNSYDEALGLPTDQSARVALRTQQILAYESGIADTVDPFGGSYFMEALTDEVEEAARDLFDGVEAAGGAVAAIEAGLMQAQIEEAAYAEARRQAAGESVVVGMNRFDSDGDEPIPVLRVDPALEERQRRRLAEWRAGRGPVEGHLAVIAETAQGNGNLLPPMKEALAAGATVGEVSDSLRGVFGVYRP
jgi:methylmalonyl-CoA mutase N-terminal domain/subunit